jgi:fumarate reductase flavoprotein subunit
MSNRIASQLPAQTDVIVLGAGLAGHCAALAAAEASVDVVLLEKSPKPGGSSVMSAGSFALAGTDLQRSAGIEDSPDRLAEELLKISGGRADPALVRVYVEHQLETYEWLKRHGVLFHGITLSSGTAVPRTHPTNSEQLISVLHARALQSSRIHFVPHTAAKRLLIGASDEVNGVEVEGPGGSASIAVRAGVVVASGGFTRNRALIERFAPGLGSAPAWGGAGNTGDGLLLAAELGADLADMQFVAGTFGVAINHYPDTSVRPGDELVLRMAMYRGGIAVNLEAKRFADESQSYKKLATLCLKQPKAIAFQIFDQPVMDQSVTNPSVNDLQGAEQRGFVRSAGTLRELAAMFGLDGEQLEATLARYNDFVDAGLDADFQRSTLGGSFGKLVPIKTPPFYALPCSVALLSTYAGLRVNETMQVLRESGAPIARLYAAGEVIGGFHGEGYMSGSALGKAAIFGRIAGRCAARLADQQHSAFSGDSI